jgi:hypothetical protein
MWGRDSRTVRGGRGAPTAIAVTMRPMTSRPEPLPADVYLDDDEEAIDGEPVLDDGADLAPVLAARADRSAVVPAGSPAVQAVAAAATGFVAGAATLALARRAGGRRAARAASRRRGAAPLPILGTQSFLIDIHMLRPGE